VGSWNTPQHRQGDAVNLWLILRMLVLLATANGAPLIARALFGSAASHPVDAGTMLPDGAPLFGHSKTVRGVLSALVATPVAAALIGFPLHVGLLVAAGAMAGDLFSSFVKRRLKLTPSSMAFGLDQIPESLVPLALAALLLPLSLMDIAIATLCFVVGEIVLSRILFRFGLRDRPY
jgi:hypothetical protein